jgi:SAM-dependent methyltransferase
MNTKIFSLLVQNLQQSFHLAKYQNIVFGSDTKIHLLPWTPVRYKKFRDAVERELHLSSDFIGTLDQITHDLDTRYSARFFGEIWKPRTDDYTYTGWALVDEINRHNPRSVLDVGCGYHPFKGRIKNIIGIDPYNNCADYQVDILEYKVHPESHDHIIALGSINFNSRADIHARMSHCVRLLAPGGHMYMRVNPGIPHAAGPWVDIFPWDFATVKEFELEFDLKLETFKKDSNNRLYFEYIKSTA